MCLLRLLNMLGLLGHYPFSISIWSFACSTCPTWHRRNNIWMSCTHISSTFSARGLHITMWWLNWYCARSSLRKNRSRHMLWRIWYKHRFFRYWISILSRGIIDGWLRMGLLPPPPRLGNFADISYLVENWKPSLLRDVCTLCSGALVCKSR